jgi:uncharacterized protein YbjT (DUF2867 family)
MILVTAGHGNQARRLIPRLVAKGKSVRAVRRSSDGEAALRDLGASSVVIGDLCDPAVAARAIDGVEAVYHIGPATHPRETQMGIGCIEAAVKAGVEHFVFSSVLHPIVDAMFNHRSKRFVEERLVCSPINFTILQPADYMETIAPPRMTFESGVFRMVWSVERKQSMVSLDDLTEVAAKVLIEGEPHYGATYELSSPDCMSGRDIAATIERVTGKPVSARQFTPDEVEERRRGWFKTPLSPEDQDYQHRFYEALIGWYNTHDFTGNAQVLRMLLGREPKRYEQFVREQYDAERALRSSAAT